MDLVPTFSKRFVMGSVPTTVLKSPSVTYTSYSVKFIGTPVLDGESITVR